MPRAPAPDGAAPDAGRLVGLLADDARLKVFAAFALGASDVDEATRASGLPVEQVRRALERLVGGGLVERAPAGRLRLVPGAFAAAARARAEAVRRVDPVDMGATAEQSDVLRNFLAGDRLREIPAHKGKRRVVLDFLASRFEPGRVYPERDVNERLRRYHDDTAALRRYLVDEGFLERREGFYWRSGGTFELDHS